MMRSILKVKEQTTRTSHKGGECSLMFICVLNSYNSNNVVQ